MSILALEVKKYIIRPALKAICLHSQTAENLVFMTGLFETGFDSFKSTMNNLGFFNCTPDNLKAIKALLMHRNNKELFERVLAATYRNILPIDDDTVLWDIRYSTIVCRLHYLRICQDLPALINGIDLFNFYIKNYATSKIINQDSKIFKENMDTFQLACDYI